MVNEPRIRLLLGYVAVLSIFGFSLMTLMPAWSVKILGGDVKLNGLSADCAWSRVIDRGINDCLYQLTFDRNKIWLTGWYLMPVALFAFAWMRWIPGSFLLLVLLGWCLMSVLNISNALIQSYVIGSYARQGDECVYHGVFRQHAHWLPGGRRIGHSFW